MADGPSSSSSFTTALIAGGLAGTAVDTLFFPIDTLKTRAQSSQGFIAAGGFNGVYRGLGSAVVGSAPGAAAFFTSYETLKVHLPLLFPSLAREDLAPALHMLSASGGEVAACMIRVPTEVVKQRSQTAAKGTGSWSVAQSVWSANGIKGFYRGFGSTVAREVPFTCLQFPMYERMKLVLARRRTSSGLVRDLPAHEAAVCGSIAGGIAAGLTTPLDVCKTRIMLSERGTATTPIVAQAAPSPLSTTEGGATAATRSTPITPPSPPPAAVASTGPREQVGKRRRHYPSSMTQTLRIIYREEGVKALFSGVVPRVIWISLGGAVFLGVYEAAKHTLNGSAAVSEDVARRD